MARRNIFGTGFFVVLILSGLVVAGCTGESNSPVPISSGTGGASSAGRGDAEAGRGGSAGALGGGPGRMMDDADAGNAAAGGDRGGEPTSTVPPGCPIPSPEPVPGQRIAIQSINFNTSEIVLRNVSSDDVTIVGGVQGWPWCNVPAYWNIAAQDVTLSPDETFAFLPYYNTTGVRVLFPGDDPFDTNEMGIYTASGSFNNSELIVAFVSWGKGAELETRESIAVLAGLWSFGERISIGAGDAGFIATGPTDQGSGYTSVPARCLVAPANE